MKAFKKFTVEGLLVYGQGSAMINQGYKADFILPCEGEGEARSLIQDRLMTGYLKDKVDFFKRWRTCSVTNIQDATQKEVDAIYVDPSLVNKLSIGELSQLAINLGLEVDPSKIPSIEDARRETAKAINGSEVEANNEKDIEEVEESEEFSAFQGEKPPVVNAEFSASIEEAPKKIKPKKIPGRKKAAKKKAVKKTEEES